MCCAWNVNATASRKEYWQLLQFFGRHQGLEWSQKSFSYASVTDNCLKPQKRKVMNVLERFLELIVVNIDKDKASFDNHRL